MAGILSRIGSKLTSAGLLSMLGYEFGEKMAEQRHEPDKIIVKVPEYIPVNDKSSSSDLTIVTNVILIILLVIVILLVILKWCTKYNERGQRNVSIQMNERQQVPRM